MIKPIACPTCSRPPTELSGKLRDSGEHWCNVFCRWCWRPERKGGEMVGSGGNLTEAREAWNRLVAERPVPAH